ncbi:hypothetical protein OXX80_006574 [Metschnikowia pulcherrima]
MASSPHGDCPVRGNTPSFTAKTVLGFEKRGKNARKMTVFKSLTDALSRGLNRVVAPGLSHVTIRLYKQSSTKADFASATKALGFSEDLSKSIYVFINDNIGGLEAEAAEKTKSDLLEKPALVKEKKAVRKTDTGGKRRLQLDLGEEDEDEILNADSGNLESTSKPDIELDQVENDIFMIDEKPRPRKITFKKIKKEDARRIKGDEGGQVSDKKETVSEDIKTDSVLDSDKNRPTNPHPNGPSHSDDKNVSFDTSDGQRVSYPETDKNSPRNTQEGTDFWQNLPNDEDPQAQENVENDRDWYTLEDSTTAAVDQYRDLENGYRPVKKNRPSQHNKSGGGFSASGEYLDYDHDESQMRSRIPIMAHFIVPPFLKGSENHLTLQIDSSRTSRSIGPSVDPVKDPESELAVAARTGSSIIKDRKEKTERAKQAKDRVTGTSQKESETSKKAVNSEQQNGAEPEPDTADYTYETIQQQRRSLPAYQARDALLKVIAENQIVVVVGETGSGKTTQITQFLAEEGYTRSLAKDGTRRLVACTQPRRVAAMSVAKRVSEEMGVKLGDDVGYTIRFEDKTSHTKTRIKYMTEGILLREILEDPLLEQYSCIIMDEAHERSLITDVLLGLFRGLLRRRRDLKLVVTSATMNADRFTRYFGNAPQFFIPGRTFPVEVFYSKSRCSDYVETAVKQVVTIHLANKKGDGDILVFMTGQEDIEATCELIQEKLALLENPPPLDVYPIYSTMPADLQKKIFTKQNAARRKVVVATNIAETSLTVDGIRYVVDCGLVKMKMFNPKLGMDALQVVPISMANAQQRSGRAGRTGPGLAYRLFTEAAASPASMYAQPIPEIQRTNLSAVMLLLKSLRVEDITRFPFLDAPPPDLLTCSLYELWAMGALEHSGKLTSLGSKMTSFPMEPTLAKLIILSCQPEFHCAAEIVTIVAMLSVPSVFYRPKERANEADSMRERFLVAESDHLTLLNVYTQWEQRARVKNMTMSKLAAWSGRNFLHHKSLLRAKEVRTQLEAIMAKLKYPMSRAKNDADIRKCICAAYFHQAASLEKMGGGRGSAEYANLRQSYMKMYLHPTSALVGGTDLSPQYVVYDELVLTKKEYMQCVTAVEPEWLLQYGYVFYGASPQVRKELEQGRNIRLKDVAELESEMKQVEVEAVKVPEKPNRAKNVKKMRNF